MDTEKELENLRSQKQGLMVMLAAIMDAIGKKEIRIGMSQLERFNAEWIELFKDHESGDLVLRLRSS